MNILAVETAWWDRKRLERLLKKALPDMNICVFDNTAAALEFARENPLGAAFIDLGKSIHVPGYFLAKEILTLQKTNIIFTNYEWEYLQYAIELRVSGYIRKPLQYEEVLEEIQNLRYPPAETGVKREGLPDSSKKGKKWRKLFNRKDRILEEETL